MTPLENVPPGGRKPGGVTVLGVISKGTIMKDELTAFILQNDNGYPENLPPGGKKPWGDIEVRRIGDCGSHRRAEDW